MCSRARDGIACRRTFQYLVSLSAPIRTCGSDSRLQARLNSCPRRSPWDDTAGSLTKVNRDRIDQFVLPMIRRHIDRQRHSLSRREIRAIPRRALRHGGAQSVRRRIASPGWDFAAARGYPGSSCLDKSMVHGHGLATGRCGEASGSSPCRKWPRQAREFRRIDGMTTLRPILRQAAYRTGILSLVRISVQRH